MIVLAHNASVNSVPFDFETLIDEPRGSAYELALDVLTDMVKATRDKKPETPAA